MAITKDEIELTEILGWRPRSVIVECLDSTENGAWIYVRYHPILAIVPVKIVFTECVGHGDEPTVVAVLANGGQGYVLRQTIKLRSYDFASHGVEVVEDFEETLAAALGDSQQLQQVFLNILNNAYDAVQDAGQRGRIRIHTRRQAEMIEVAISDNGTGISDPQRIFDPFYTTKQVGKGTGLGLSICYGIVRAHGGEIQCWNNEAGPGSTFVVRIPVATEAAMAAAAAKEAGR